ncbi:MAG: outer membrane protein assembly factor BamE [Acidiferrobacterales bacterium]|nr:outer membrane protein assembly factor BamE [Acidiferrobacterales bacterium]
MFLPRTLKILLSSVALTLVLGLTSGCVYRQDVQQGNEITQEMIDKVKPGMSRREIIRILGYPLINDPFNRDRWDYYYSLKQGRSKTVSSQSATLVFEGDNLKSIDARLSDEETDTQG